MINVIFRRYKLLFFIGILILAFQIFLAYKSFKIPLDDDGKSHNNLNINDYFEDYSISSKQNKQHKKQFQVNSNNDDEDIINSNHHPDVATTAVKNSEKATSLADLLLSELKFKPNCDILRDKEVISALQRAKTHDCKKHIVDIACQIKSGELYPKTLPNLCPSGSNYIANRSIGCFKDEKKNRLLSSYYSNYKETNSPKKCIQICLQSGYLYAGVQYSSECFCGNDEPSINFKLPDSKCIMKCPAEQKETCGGYYTMNIYETGIAKFTPQVAESLPKIAEEKIKIVFLLTLNGRALRQVYRLIKSLYSVNHYYYIHIDSRQSYLYRELLKLESIFPNVRLARKRYATIWGGASLLEMLLNCMTDLLKMKNWEWDFVLNLSESDFPVKTIDKLTNFLTANKNKNFVKSHGREVQRFIQKQGLDKTFIECDTHMWRIGDRKLPDGIQIDGGSDWVCLSREFVTYVTLKRDTLIEGLLKIFQYTLLPAESFFHTAIRNSLFCDTYIDNNLHLTNWKRKLGCKCQYRHICDWCGCSPNDFKPDDWSRLEATEQKQLFFARKFEPVVNQLVILQLEEWLFGPYPETYVNLNSYWQNVYHHQDTSPTPNPALLIIAESLLRVNSKSNQYQQFYQPLKLLEVTDYFELDVYKGFLMKHKAKINTNLTVELETWCKPSHLYAQVSKTNNIAKKIMQLEVSTDFDQKEQMSRNFIRAIGQNSEPVLIVKLAGTSKVDNNTILLTVLWVDPDEKIQESGELVIEDITITSINFSKSNLKLPLKSGTWTVKLVQKKTVIGLTKFLVTPSYDMSHSTTIMTTKEDTNTSHNQLDKQVANFYIIKDTCITYSHKSIREIVGSYLSSHINSNAQNIVKFNECKKTFWSSLAPDPKSNLIHDGNLINDVS